MAEIDRRRDCLQRHAEEGTRVEMLSVPSGYASIESERDAVMVGPHLVAGLEKAEADGADAGIVGR